MPRPHFATPGRGPGKRRTHNTSQILVGQALTVRFAPALSYTSSQTKTATHAGSAMTGNLSYLTMSNKNLMPDPDGMNISAGWVGEFSAAHVNNVGPNSNSGGWQVLGGASQANISGVDNSNNRTPVKLGQTYTASIWVDATNMTAGSSNLYIRGWGPNNAGGAVATVGFSGGSAGRQSLSYAVPSDGSITALSIQAWGTGTVTNGLPFIWANPQLEQTSSATSYQGTLRPIIAATISKSGVLSFTGTIVKSAVVQKIASLPFTSSMIRSLTVGKAAILTFSSKLLRNLTPAFINAGLSFTGILKKSIIINKIANLPFTSSIVRTVSTGKAAVLSFTANLAKNPETVFIHASLGFNAGLTKMASLGKSATLSFSGTVSKTILATKMAVLSFSGNTTKQVTIGKGVTLSFNSSVNKLIVVNALQNLSFSGTINKYLGIFKSATLSFIGKLTKQIQTHILANLSFIGFLIRSREKNFNASLSFTGSFTTSLVEIFANMVRFTLSQTQRAQFLSDKVVDIARFTTTMFRKKKN